MATVIAKNGVPIMDSFRTKRTEAMPKTSLFGSALEIQDDETLQSVRNIDLKAEQAQRHKKTGPKYNLPEDVKAQLQGSQVLEKSRHTVNTQRDLVNQAREQLRQKEEQALSFNFPPQSHESTTARSRNDQRWFSKKDLEGSKNINSVGLNKNQSYNRDKYGSKPPIHQYQLIGDILQPGMDFPRRERTEIQMRNQGYGMGDLRGVLAVPSANPSPRESQSARSTSKNPAINLPPNIKHGFGTKVCDNLLSDQDKVKQTLEKQKAHSESIKRKSQPFEVPKFTKDLKPEYEMLGNALRQNVCPGYTMNHKISTTKTAFTDQVHLFRVPDPDKWRYQRDDLSTWAEHNVLRQRMTKAWDQYFHETLAKKQPKI